MQTGMWGASGIVRWICAAFAAFFVLGGPVPDSEAATNQLFGFNEWANPSNFAVQRGMNMPVRRINVGWNVVQSSDSSTWDWSDFDSQYQAIVGAGLKPLIVAVA